jgi:hypothetical protein
LTVEGSPVKPVWLESLVGFHPINGFAQVVEIAQGVAVALSIQPALQAFGHEGQLFEGWMVSVPIQPLEVSPGARTVLGRRRSASADAARQSTVRPKGQRERLANPT